MVKDVVPMRNRPVDQPDLPKIVNLVSTVILLPQRPDLPKEKQFKLPLEAISMKMGFSQYAPILFAANIMKLTDSIADITALLFSSGKMVLVSGKTENHTRAISQYVRVNIEGVECMMMDDNGKVYKGSLKGRTIFQHCNIHNIVGHGFLGCRIDLQAMCDAAPASCKWFPDLFPGLKCKIWLNASHRCTCRTALKPVVMQTDEDGAITKLTGKIGKCTCALKVLIFDSGCVVITGGRHVRDVNSVFFRIKQLAPQFVAASNGQAVIPREDRFYQRLSSMMVPSGMTTKQAAQVQRAELKPEEAIASVLAGVVPVSTATAGEKKKARTVAAAAARDGGTPLMRMAEAGRVDDVTMLLMMDPGQAKERDAEGRSPLERINAIPIQDRTIEHKKIIELLNVYL